MLKIWNKTLDILPVGSRFATEEGMITNSQQFHISFCIKCIN